MEKAIKQSMVSECHYKCQVFENGEWVAVTGAQLPFYVARTLDESLDTGKLVVGVTQRKQPFLPFTLIRFLIAVNRVNSLEHNRPFVEPDYTQYEPIYMLIMTDSVTNNGQYYKHEIELIELSKWLERDICDTLTFTNALATNSNIANISTQDVVLPPDTPYYFDINDTTYKPPATTIVGSSYYVEGCETLFKIMRKPAPGTTIEWRSSSNTKVTYPSGKVETIPYDTNRYLELNEIGTYSTLYHCVYEIVEDTGFVTIETIDVPLTIEVISGADVKPRYTITDVVNRILEVGVTRRVDIDRQKYILSADFATKYAEVSAPEFHITRSNIFEALLQVGAYIHAIPRIVWDEETNTANKIVFDELGGSEEYTLPSYCLLQSYLGGIDAEGYCGNLDSIVENLITTTDEEQGSVVEPDYNAYKTLRAEEGTWRISNDTVVFLTDFPIYRILKFEMGYISNGFFVGELVPFVYEAAEYGTLTSYQGTFPYAKMYALKYTQGGYGISAFTYKSENAISPAFSSPTIENILEKLNITLELDAKQYKNLAYRITYIPAITSRVKQFKPYNNFPLHNSLLFNQSANTVETEFYGEHLKGTIARIGNETIKETYYFRLPTDIPKVGQIMNGMYIVATEVEYTDIGFNCTITMTPNYNKLSEFLGLNSNYRLFDVSEKQSVDRFSNYSEICEIGDTIAIDQNAGITPNGVKAFAATFTQESGYLPASVALTQGLAADKTPIKSLVLHACASSAVGNSIAFTWSYKDNFNAGYKSTYLDISQNTQRLVPYGNEFGEMYYLSLQIGANVKTTNWADQIMPNGWCDNLPVFNGDVPSSAVLFDYATKPFIIQKDSRENIAVTSQLHFVANRQSIVIGQALAHNNLLVTRANKVRAAVAVFLPYTLNALNTTPNLYLAVDATMPTITTNSTNKQITIGTITNTTNTTFKSWALVDKENGTIYLGENLDLAPNTATKPITLTFKSNK